MDAAGNAGNNRKHDMDEIVAFHNRLLGTTSTQHLQHQQTQVQQRIFRNSKEEEEEEKEEENPIVVRVP